MENLDVTQSLFATLFAGAGVAIIKLIEGFLAGARKVNEKREERILREAEELREGLRQDNQRLETRILNMEKIIRTLREEKWALLERVKDAEFEVKERNFEITMLKKQIDVLKETLDTSSE